MLYCALITLHFDLGNTLYVSASPSQLNKLQVIQNAAARLILLADARCPTYELHERPGLDTQATRATKALVRIIYCCIHHKAPPYLYGCLTTVEHHGRI